MRTTRNQRHKVHTKQTYSLKKLRTGKLILALVGSFAVGTATIATSVNATEWTARTAEEIKQDIGDFSKPYTIKWGDTLSAIQEATGIDYHKIAADNGIEDVNLIYAGNILYNKNGYTAVANVQTGEVKVYQAQTPTPTANTQAAVSNAVAKTVVKDVTDSKDEKVQEIKQELQQSVKSNGQVTDKNDTQTVKSVEASNKLTEKPVVKPAETPSQPVEQPTVKPVETPSQPVEQPTVKPVETPSQPAEEPAEKPAEKPAETPSQPVEKPVETPSQPVEQPTVKPAETPSQPAEKPAVKPVETSKGTPEVQPELPELVIEKGTPEVQPELPEATLETVDVNEEIPFKETTQDTTELYQGQTRRVPGAKGVEKVTYEVVKENGVEKSRTAIKREVTTQAKDAIVYRGTKPPVTAKGEPLVQPALKELVITEKGEPEVQPELPEATVETVVVNNDIPFEEITQDDPELNQGETRSDEGVKGVEKVTYEVVKENGVEKSRSEISRTLIVSPKNAITYRGTKKVIAKGTPEVRDENPEFNLTKQTRTVTTVTKEAEMVAIPDMYLNEGVEHVEKEAIDGKITETIEELIGEDGTVYFRNVINKTETKVQNGVVRIGKKTPTSDLGNNGFYNIQEHSPNEHYINFHRDVTLDAKEMKALTAEERYERSKQDLHNTLTRVSEEGTVKITDAAPLSDKTIDGLNNGTYLDHKVMADEMLNLVNKERTSKGLTALEWSNDLNQYAKIRTNELRDNGHIRFFNEKNESMKHVRDNNGTPWHTVLKDTKYQYAFATENAAGYALKENLYHAFSEKAIAEQLFTQWKNSPGHYANMMKKGFKYFAFDAQFSKFYRTDKDHVNKYLNGVQGIQLFSSETYE